MKDDCSHHLGEDQARHEPVNASVAATTDAPPVAPVPVGIRRLHVAGMTAACVIWLDTARITTGFPHTVNLLIAAGLVARTVWLWLNLPR